MPSKSFPSSLTISSPFSDVGLFGSSLDVGVGVDIMHVHTHVAVTIRLSGTYTTYGVTFNYIFVSFSGDA